MPTFNRCRARLRRGMLQRPRLRFSSSESSQLVARDTADVPSARSPLYRPNLHYSVIKKDASAPQVIRDMVDFISKYHDGECGIVYCLSRADTENVAKGIVEESKGRIQTAVCARPVLACSARSCIADPLPLQITLQSTTRKRSSSTRPGERRKSKSSSQRWRLALGSMRESQPAAQLKRFVR